MSFMQIVQEALSRSNEAKLEATKLAEANKFNYKNYKLPILYLNGGMTGISKETKVNLNYIYGDHKGTCTLKWQGSSSIRYPKKNYTISFDSPFEAKKGWGSQKKYCLKANYIDFSHARNVVSAKLWGQMVKSRTTKNELLNNLPNGGAIDGFPIMLVINDIYQGLYSFNIPKDKWMFSMDSGEKNCIVCAEEHSNATLFAETITRLGPQFELEYAKDEGNTQWIIDSLNTLINTILNNDNANYKEEVGKYMDIDSAIDYYIFACLTSHTDGRAKNFLLHTFDGVKWGFTAYDMDTVFGNHFDGTAYYKADVSPTFSYYVISKIMNLIYKYDKERLKQRYMKMRKSVFSEDNVSYMFYNYLVNIPKALFDEEVKLWSTLPGTQTNNITQILNNFRLRCELLDNEIENL